jgi:hypothetical protein
MRPGLRQVDLTGAAGRRRTHAGSARCEQSYAVMQRLEETRAHHDHIFGLEKVIGAGLEI